jgi:hypothetical protein
VGAGARPVEHPSKSLGISDRVLASRRAAACVANVENRYSRAAWYFFLQPALFEGNDGFELSVPGRAIRPFGRGEDVFQ